MADLLTAVLILLALGAWALAARNWWDSWRRGTLQRWWRRTDRTAGRGADLDVPGPTVIRAITGPVGPERIAIEGRCACGDAYRWRPETDGKFIAQWLTQHADHRTLIRTEVPDLYRRVPHDRA